MRALFSGQRTVLKACRRKQAIYLKSMKENGMLSVDSDNNIREDCFNNNQLSSTNHCHSFQKLASSQHFSGELLKKLKIHELICIVL